MVQCVLYGVKFISISGTVSAWLTTVTDRQTDRLYDRKGLASLRYAAKTCSTVIGLMPFRGLCLRVRHVWKVHIFQNKHFKFIHRNPVFVFLVVVVKCNPRCRPGWDICDWEQHVRGQSQSKTTSRSRHGPDVFKVKRSLVHLLKEKLN